MKRYTKEKIISVSLLGVYFFGNLGMVSAYTDANGNEQAGPPTEQQQMLDDQWSADDEKNASSSSAPSGGSDGGCSYDGQGSVQGALKGCAPKGSITSENYTIDGTGGVKAKVVKITNQLIIAGSILSVGGIVFAAILYVTALGDGEKVKKAKTALKFSIVGFIVMLLSFPIVNAIVNMIYEIGK